MPVVFLRTRDQRSPPMVHHPIQGTISIRRGHQILPGASGRSPIPGLCRQRTEDARFKHDSPVRTCRFPQRLRGFSNIARSHAPPRMDNPTPPEWGCIRHRNDGASSVIRRSFVSAPTKPGPPTPRSAADAHPRFGRRSQDGTDGDRFQLRDVTSPAWQWRDRAFRSDGTHRGLGLDHSATRGTRSPKQLCESYFGFDDPQAALCLADDSQTPPPPNGGSPGADPKRAGNTVA